MRPGFRCERCTGVMDRVDDRSAHGRVRVPAGQHGVGRRLLGEDIETGGEGEDGAGRPRGHEQEGPAHLSTMPERGRAGAVHHDGRIFLRQIGRLQRDVEAWATHRARQMAAEDDYSYIATARAARDRGYPREAMALAPVQGPEQAPERVLASARALASASVRVRAAVRVPVQLGRTSVTTVEVLQGLAALGAYGIKIPREYGGLGFSQTTYGRALQIIASRCGSTGA